MDVEGHEAGEDLGLLGRLRLTDHWELEAEISKSELSDSTRVDRRLGGAIMYDFSPYNRWSLYALGGMGVSQTDLGGGDFSAEQGYAELGLGLNWRLSRNLVLSADIRAGARETAGDDIALRTVEPVAVQDEENYTRARLSAILYF
jgi:hypothetical protein